MTVNVEHMRAWVQALRSGEFQQGKRNLRVYADTGKSAYMDDDTRGYTYCCLGVACEVMTKVTGQGHNYSLANSTLPRVVQGFLGIDAADPQLNVGDYVRRITGAVPEGGRLAASALNDEEEWTFLQLAAAIERTWPEVKVA